MTDSATEKNPPEDNSDDESKTPSVPPPAGPKKITEKPDNLRNREDWFRKRSG